MKVKNRIATTLQSGLSELGEFSARRYALFGVTITGLVFEWSPANEAVLAAIGVNAHEQLGTTGSIIQSVAGRIATGSVTGMVSFAEQAIVGSLTALSVHQFPNTFKVWQESRPDNSLSGVSSTSSTITALALGSSMAVIEKSIVDKNSNLKNNLNLAIKTSAIVGSCNFVLAGVVSGGLDVLDRNGQEQLSSNIADTVKNPLLYVGLFGLAKIISVRKGKKSAPIIAK